MNLPNRDLWTKIDKGLLMVLAAAVAHVLFAALYLIRPQGPFCWDEAHRSLVSLMIAKSMQAADWKMFWNVTNHQVYWPFLHAWVSSVFLLLGGFHEHAARAMSVTAHVGSILFLYLLGKQMHAAKGRLIGLLAVALFLACPLASFLSATAMAESLGTCLTLSVLLCYMTGHARGSRRHFVCAGVLLALLYFTKYVYAVFMVLGLSLHGLSLVLMRETRSQTLRSWRQWRAMALTALTLYALWIIMPPTQAKIAILAQRLKETGGFDILKYGLLDRLLFYPRALLNAYTFSPWIFLLFVGGIAWSGRQWRDDKTRLMLILFVANLVAMGISRNLQERFIFTTVPCLFLLTASFVVHGLAAVPDKRHRLAVAGVILVLIVGDLHKMPEGIRVTGNSTLGVLNFKAPKERPRTTLFGLVRLPGFLQHPTNMVLPKPSDVVPTHDMRDVYRFIWENTEPGTPMSAVIALNAASPHIWRWHGIVQNRMIVPGMDPRCTIFVAMDVSPNSFYRTLPNQSLIAERTTPAWHYLDTLAQQGQLRIMNEAEFPDMGIRVRIYGR